MLNCLYTALTPVNMTKHKELILVLNIVTTCLLNKNVDISECSDWIDHSLSEVLYSYNELSQLIVILQN